MINVNAVSGSRLQVAGSIERGEDPKKVADVQRPTAQAAQGLPIPKDKMHIPYDLEYFQGRVFEKQSGTYIRAKLTIEEENGAYILRHDAIRTDMMPSPLEFNITKGIITISSNPYRYISLPYDQLYPKGSFFGFNEHSAGDVLDYVAQTLSYLKEDYPELGAVEDYILYAKGMLATASGDIKPLIPDSPIDRFLGVKWQEDIPFTTAFFKSISSDRSYHSQIRMNFDTSGFEAFADDRTIGSSGSTWGTYYMLNFANLDLYVKPYQKGGSPRGEYIPFVDCRWKEVMPSVVHIMAFGAENASDEYKKGLEYIKYLATLNGCPTTDVEGEQAEMLFSLKQNYPNPFNPVTTISFSLPKAGDAKVVISDVLGRTVKTFELANLQPGTNSVTWDASGENSGVYNCTLIAGDKVQTRQMTLVK